MHVLYFVLLLVAVICFGASALNVTSRLNLLALGLFAWALVPLLQFAQRL